MNEHRLAASALMADSRVAEARRLLQEALFDCSAQLTTIHPPSEAFVPSYEETLKRFESARGAPVFYRYLGSGIGNGALVELADGSVKYDMITGIGAHGFGHSDPELLQVGIDAALSDTVMQGNLQQNLESALFSEELIAAAQTGGAELLHCFLTTSGAMANENALKLMFHARPGTDRLLAFAGGFAGRTLALSQVTDRPEYRAGLPTTVAVDYVPFFDSGNPSNSTAEAVKTINQHLRRYPNRHGAMMMELVQGEGGFYVAPPEFFRSVANALQPSGVPLLIDEIQTFGRTGQLFAFQHLGLEDLAQVVTVGKMTQVCATLFSDQFLPPRGLISQTFTGATSSIMAARSVVRRLREGAFYGEAGRIAQIHRRFVGHLESLATRQPGLIRGPWGIGGMLAFTPLAGEAEEVNRVLHELFESGVIAFATGFSPKRIRLLPPVGVITDQQIDDVCGVIEGVLTATAHS